MKSSKEWYEELPEPYRSKAIKNCLHPDLLDKSLEDAIFGMNKWNSTPEGHDYWSDVINKIRKGEFNKKITYEIY